MKLITLPLLAALILAGCATAPPIDRSKLPVIPAQFKEGDGRWTVAAPAEAQPRGEWWKAFSDPILEDLIARANSGNASIQVAAARLAQARALVRSTEADRAVQVDAGASASRLQGIVSGSSGPARNLFSAGANLSYEVDLFGRLARTTDAAVLDVQAREGLLQSARLLVQAEVAQTYLALRALDVERALVRSTVGAYRGTLTLTERRFRAGDVAELDVARARTEVAATEAEALALDRRRAELEHALAVLVGEVSSSFELRVADWNTALPVIPAGVPSTVLSRRPDVSAAQSTMLAAQTRVGVAKSAWFPRVALTGTGGCASLRLLAEHSEAQSRAVDSASRSTALSDSRYRNGLVSQLELLDAQRSELRNRRAALQVRSAQYQATVGLVRALGGGWES
jgi:multidrug efflux system outer membrane protein